MPATAAVTTAAVTAVVVTKVTGTDSVRPEPTSSPRRAFGQKALLRLMHGNPLPWSYLVEDNAERMAKPYSACQRGLRRSGSDRCCARSPVEWYIRKSRGFQCARHNSR